VLARDEEVPKGLLGHWRVKKLTQNETKVTPNAVLRYCKVDSGSAAGAPEVVGPALHTPVALRRV
jgi:hypothetical protein